MALALRFDKLLREGVVKDFRTLARLGHVSQARISYLCPNKFLVDQTCLQAQRFGIPVTNGNASYVPV